MDTPVVEQPTAPHTSPAQEADLNPISLIKKAWKLYTSNWVTYVAIQIISGLLSFVFIAIAVGLGFYLYFVSAGGKTENLLSILPALILLGGFALIILILVFSIGQLALLISVIRSGEKLGAVPSFKASLKKVIPFSIFSFVVSLVTVGAFMLFYIPGILFSLWFSVAAYVYLIENETIWNSLMKSRAYTKGHTIELLVAFFVLLIGYVLVSYLPSIIPLVMGEESTASSLSNLVTIPLGFIAGPLQMLIGFVIYQELKRVAPQPVTMPSKVPYIITSLLGYVLFFLLIGAIVSTIIPRVGEFMNNRAQTMNEKPEGAEDTFYYSDVMSDTNNTHRSTHVVSMLNAVMQYKADKGKLPGQITVKPLEITSDGGVDLCSALVPDYMASLPVDPSMSDSKDGVTDCDTFYSTGYYISAVSTGNEEPVVTIRATHAEAGEDISFSR